MSPDGKPKQISLDPKKWLKETGREGNAVRDQIGRAVSMIATELLYALIDKMSDTVFEWKGDIEEFKHPIYS